MRTGFLNFFHFLHERYVISIISNYLGTVVNVTTKFIKLEYLTRTLATHFPIPYSLLHYIVTHLGTKIFSQYFPNIFKALIPPANLFYRIFIINSNL